MAQTKADFIRYFTGTFIEAKEERPNIAAVTWDESDIDDVRLLPHYAAFCGDDESLNQLLTHPLLQKPNNLLHWVASSMDLEFPTKFPDLSSFLVREGIGHMQGWVLAVLPRYIARFIFRNNGYYIPSYKQVVQTILNKGLGTIEECWGGNTPLLRSAINCNVLVMQALLECKADVHVKRKDDGLTPLAAVLTAGVSAARKVESLRLLYQYGAQHESLDLLPAVAAGIEVLREVLPRIKDPNSANNKGETALMLAAAQLDVESVELLLKSAVVRAGVNAKNKDGNTALHLVFTKAEQHNTSERPKTKNQEEAILRMLLAAGADPNIGRNDRDTNLLLQVVRYFPEHLDTFFEATVVVRPGGNYNFHDGHTVFTYLIVSEINQANRYHSAVRLVEEKVEGDYSTETALRCVSSLLSELRGQINILGMLDKNIFTLLLAIGKRVGIEDQCQQLQSQFFAGEFLQFRDNLYAIQRRIHGQQHTQESKQETIEYRDKGPQHEGYAQSILLYSNSNTLPVLLTQTKITLDDWQQFKLFDFAIKRGLLHALKYIFGQGIIIRQLISFPMESQFSPAGQRVLWFAICGELFSEAIKHNNLELLDLFFTQFEKEFPRSENVAAYQELLAKLLQSAVDNKLLEVVKYLIEKRGAKVTAGHVFLAISAVDHRTVQEDFALTLLKIFMREVRLVDVRDSEGRSLLHCAVSHNCTQATEFLFNETGYEETNSGIECKQSRNTEVALVSARKSDTEQEWLTCVDQSGNTALHAAIAKASVACVELLMQQHVKHRVSLNSKNRLDKTALNLTVAMQSSDKFPIVAALLAARVDLGMEPEVWLIQHFSAEFAADPRVFSMLRDLTEQYNLNLYKLGVIRIAPNVCLLDDLSLRNQLVTLKLLIRLRYEYHEKIRQLEFILSDLAPGFYAPIISLVVEYCFSLLGIIQENSVSGVEYLRRQFRKEGVAAPRLVQSSTSVSNEQEEKSDDDDIYDASDSDPSDDEHDNDEERVDVYGFRRLFN